jgi:hypothetical protein
VLSAIMPGVVMLSFIKPSHMVLLRKCRQLVLLCCAEYHNAKCCYAGCHTLVQ